MIHATLCTYMEICQILFDVFQKCCLIRFFLNAKINIVMNHFYLFVASIYNSACESNLRRTVSTLSNL